MFRAPAVPAAPAAASSQLTLADVTKRHPHHVVLDRVSLSVRPGEKAGVIGDNGSGKSTLLRLLAGAERPDNGTVTVVAPGGVGHLAQTLDLPDSARVGDAVDLALAELRALERRIGAAAARLDEREPSSYEEYAALVEEFEARGGYGADRRVDVALRHLGEHTGLDRARRLGTLSGGQRSRLALAATLAAAPELLLLDEPTNDLDDEAVAWLEERLRAHRGTLVAVTHDRTFLDRVTDTILEVDHETRSVRRYGNGYAGYLTAKAAERARQAREYEEWRAEVARRSRLADSHIGRLDAIPRKAPAAFSGAGAFRARSRAHGAMSRIRDARERLARLAANPAPRPPEPLRFTAAIAGTADRAVELADVRVPGRLALDELHVPAGGRLLVTGPNGAGKSTLLRVLAGELAPDPGATVRRPARVGLLRQVEEPLSRPGGNRSVLAAFGAERAEELLALGLFRERDLVRPVRDLSTGQRRRLALARLVSEPYDLLLLDEPTNHLAPSLVEDLEAALAAYPGTVVVVSHDRRLREAFPGQTLRLG
ncbi:ribosomal protection-like ABC-F family protein [Streptomyces spectabilis]|uniref:ABC transporter ATP-binding protein n=1 Tax=Streptomyces spectabilis TaxID=68270 RepID=A0A5P2X8K6_STRST|nr:ABC-F family ATP-binding cassette domain-containing protein [Streptomyces spectabilis]MBB5106544.1 macrolide transport system ATP-binding/permease protein [Streptomyces spectabilis]MCI3903598.1 ATP-binding cassette domain-containing protein [Streptomyces spectabilis]QEV60788.1 ABC transporter ATP-binding protein [Streptomyces spectabilis]GGV47980.1 ABC transporter ATP-binding protein [Streptomyces spectabilis]